MFNQHGGIWFVVHQNNFRHTIDHFYQSNHRPPHKRSSKLTSYFITIAADVCCNRKVHHCVRRFRTFLKEMKHLGRSVQRIKGETFPTFSSQV
ncbi:MAG: hypothetical protein ACTS6A_01020 [Candidatus Hodgkinia cicadicola]